MKLFCLYWLEVVIAQNLEGHGKSQPQYEVRNHILTRFLVEKTIPELELLPTFRLICCNWLQIENLRLLLFLAFSSLKDLKCDFRWLLDARRSNFLHQLATFILFDSVSGVIVEFNFVANHEAVIGWESTLVRFPTTRSTHFRRVIWEKPQKDCPCHLQVYAQCWGAARVR